MYIIGIDPGTRISGYAVVESSVSTLRCVEMGVLMLANIDSLYERMSRLHKKVVYLSQQYPIEHMAVEAPFCGKNPQSALKLGRIQGAAITAGVSVEMTITEYLPREIKKAVTGYGNASKQLIRDILSKAVSIEGVNEIYQYPDDASDALAAAICHHYRSSGLQTEIQPSNNVTKKSSSKSSWSAFVEANPDRIK